MVKASSRIHGCMGSLCQCLPSRLLPTGAAIAGCGFGGLLKTGKHTGALLVNLSAAYVVGGVVTATGDRRCIRVIKGNVVLILIS